MTGHIWISAQPTKSEQTEATVRLWDCEIVTQIVIRPPVCVGPGESGMWALGTQLCNIFPFSPSTCQYYLHGLDTMYQYYYHYYHHHHNHTLVKVGLVSSCVLLIVLLECQSCVAQHDKMSRTPL